METTRTGRIKGRPTGERAERIALVDQGIGVLLRYGEWERQIAAAGLPRLEEAAHHVGERLGLMVEWLARVALQGTDEMQLTLPGGMRPAAA